MKLSIFSTNNIAIKHSISPIITRALLNAGISVFPRTLAVCIFLLVVIGQRFNILVDLPLSVVQTRHVPFRGDILAPYFKTIDFHWPLSGPHEVLGSHTWGFKLLLVRWVDSKPPIFEALQLAHRHAVMLLVTPLRSSSPITPSLPSLFCRSPCLRVLCYANAYFCSFAHFRSRSSTAIRCPLF